MSLGVTVRGIRQAANLSLSDLASLAGVSKTYLLRIETDPEANPTIGVLRQIATALDVRLFDLLDEDDDMNPPRLWIVTHRYEVVARSPGKAVVMRPVPQFGSFSAEPK